MVALSPFSWDSAPSSLIICGKLPAPASSSYSCVMLGGSSSSRVNSSSSSGSSFLSRSLRLFAKLAVDPRASDVAPRFSVSRVNAFFDGVFLGAPPPDEVTPYILALSSCFCFAISISLAAFSSLARHSAMYACRYSTSISPPFGCGWCLFTSYP